MFIYSNTRARASQKKFAEKGRDETMNKGGDEQRGAAPHPAQGGFFQKAPLGIRKNFDM